MTTTLTVPARFNGPASSGNGGWTAGALAEAASGLGLESPVTVRLRTPPPLEEPLDVVRTADVVELRRGDHVVAEAASAVDLTWSPPAAVDLPEARQAEGRFPGRRSHPFPRCFSCGTARDDGLGIHPGAVGGGRVAATWVPNADLARAGEVTPPVTWAALDCVSAWSSDLEDRPLVLARMTAEVSSPPQAGTPYVVVGTTVAVDGRKTWTASALYDEAGSLVAQAQHLWIAISADVVRQLQEG